MICASAILSRIGKRTVMSGNAVIGSADGQVGPAHFQPALAQAREGLRRGDFMHQMQIDVQQRGRAWRSATTWLSQTFSMIVRGLCAVPCLFDINVLLKFS